MRLILRLIGGMLVLAALWPLGREALMLLQGPTHRFIPLGQIWYEIDPASLNMLQAGVQRRLSPGLWEHGIQVVLTWPAWPVLVVLGLMLIILGRARGA